MTLQIFVLSPEPQIPSQTLTLTTSSTQTLHHLKLSLLPKPLTESFSSSFYFTLNGKPPPDSTLLESPQIAPLSTLSGRKHGINVKVVEKMVSSKLDENGKSANGGVVNGSSKRFKGEKIHDILFQVLEKEGDVIIRHGTQSIENRHAASQGMHTSKFCLNPAGDTPSACQLFDSMVSLCIPVIISDSIELPFEDVIDYTKIGIFVDSMSALKP